MNFPTPHPYTRRKLLKHLGAAGASLAASAAGAQSWQPITPANIGTGSTWKPLTVDTGASMTWRRVGRQQVANCAGYLPNGLCHSNPKWIPPSGAWQNWGLGFTATNVYGYTGTLTNCSTVTVNPIAHADGNWNYCNCGSNCTFFFVNCNCNCACDCANCNCGGFCCFPKGTQVKLQDGRLLPIESVEEGAKLAALHGVNDVEGLIICLLKPGDKVFSINDTVECTWEQLFLGIDGRWRAVDVAGYRTYRAMHRETNPDFGLEDDAFEQLRVGDTLHTDNGPLLVESLKTRTVEADEVLHSFVLTGNRTFFANDFLVESRVSEDCFDLSSISS